MRRLLVIAALFCCYPIAADADTHTAASCSRADVQAQVDAAADGDVVSIPSGTCVYTSSVTNTKSITIQGSGATVIRDQTSTAAADYAPFSMSVSSGGTYTVQDLIFLPSSAATGTSDAYGNPSNDIGGFLFVSNDSATPLTVIIQRCTFGTADSPLRGGSGIFLRGMIKGVIAHNSFRHDWSGSGTPHSITYTGWIPSLDSGVHGAHLWSLANTWGTDDPVYIEDNTFYSPPSASVQNTIIDNDEGARFVFRYNSSTNGYIGSHGRDGSYVHDGMKSFEVYSNTFYADKNTNGHVFAIMGVRSGTGVFYNNTASGLYDMSLWLYNYCSSSACANCTAAGYNCPAQTLTTYPQLDQVGYASNGLGAQVSEPVYIWGNSFGTISQPYIYTSGTYSWTANVIQWGRDAYKDGTQKAGYSAYTYPHPRVGSPPASHLVDADARSNGTLSCNSPVADGATTICTATPSAGYRVASISGCGGTWTSGSATYTTAAISQSCTVTATFHNSKIESFGTSQRITVGTGNRLTIP